MKIKSFKGRRLIAELAIEDVSAKTEIAAVVINKIESIETEIKKLDEFYNNLPDED